MGRVVEKRVFNNRVVFHFNDLLWPQNSCLIKSKRNWTPFFSSKKRKITQKLPNTQTANFLYKKLRPQKNNKQCSPLIRQGGAVLGGGGLFALWFFHVHQRFESQLGGLRWRQGKPRRRGEAAKLKRWNPAPTSKGQGAGVTWEQVSRFVRSQVCYLEIFRSWQDAFLSCTLQSLPEGQPGGWFEAVIARDRCPQQHGMRSHQLGQSQGKQDQGKQVPDRSGDSSWSGTSSTKLVETVGKYMVSLVSQTQVLKMEHLRECMLRASQVEQPAVAEDPTTEVIL